jgi:hypothetical protein
MNGEPTSFIDFSNAVDAAPLAFLADFGFCLHAKARYITLSLRRRGRVAEGGGLLNHYTL